MMDNPLNKIIMNEIGLTVDSQSRVMDQDTREHLQFRSKNMKYSSQNQVTLGNKDMVFDPASNKNVMSSLFDYYANKIQNEEDGKYVSMYNEKVDGDKSSLEVRVDGETIISGQYHNDSLKYVDAIMRLNGNKNVDLSDYDKKESEQQDNKPNKRQGRGMTKPYIYRN